MPDDISLVWDAGADFGDEAPVSIAQPREGIVALGHDRGVFYYLSQAAGQVFDLTPAAHNKSSLMAMASVPYYWEGTRFRGKNGVRWEEAADNLMTECRNVGIYNPDQIRGRGVWIDAGRAVLHLGDRLIVDGAVASLRLSDSKHIYELSRPMGHLTAQPLDTVSAHRLVQICQRLRWERGISGVLLAGFIAVAPICGGLSWRPGIWIVGGTGTGKTYLKDNILIPALGGIALQVQSKTSEAGIRQTLGCDARPVIFDEAESEDQAAAHRMQSVLDLVRQSSSEGGADIVKGSADGRARRYRIRSCFCFSSINSGLLHEADSNRITTLALRALEKSDEAAFQSLHAAVVSTITPAFSAGLIARSVKLLQVIRENSETFAQAVSVHLGSRRAGDQIGTLLAGAYSLHSERRITYEQAVDYIKRQDWSDASVEETSKDEQRLLGYLTQHRLRFSTGNGQSNEATIGRLILAASNTDHQIIGDVAHTELLAVGIRFEWRTDSEPGVYISTRHPALARILSDTPWAKQWSRALLRLSGAEACQTAKRFGPGFQSKATWLPMAVVDPEEPIEWSPSHPSPAGSPDATY